MISDQLQQKRKRSSEDDDEAVDNECTKKPRTEGKSVLPTAFTETDVDKKVVVSEPVNLTDLSLATEFETHLFKADRFGMQQSKLEEEIPKVYRWMRQRVQDNENCDEWRRSDYMRPALFIILLNKIINSDQGLVEFFARARKEGTVHHNDISTNTALLGVWPKLRILELLARIRAPTTLEYTTRHEREKADAEKSWWRIVTVPVENLTGTGFHRYRLWQEPVDLLSLPKNSSDM